MGNIVKHKDQNNNHNGIQTDDQIGTEGHNLPIKQQEVQYQGIKEKDEVSQCQKQTPKSDQQQKGNKSEKKEQNQIAHSNQALRIDQIDITKHIPEIQIHNQDEIRSNQPTNRSGPTIQQYDAQKVNQLYRKLVLNQIPMIQAKHVRLLERKRILILWLKSGAETQKQNNRDKVLRQDGYEVYSSRNIEKLVDRYHRIGKKSVTLSVTVLYSISEGLQNQQNIKDLHNYFILQGRTQRLGLVKPSQNDKFTYYTNAISTLKKIVELPFQIQLIRRKINQLESECTLAFNLVTLKYCHNFTGLYQMYASKDAQEVFNIKTKVAIQSLLNISCGILQLLDQKFYLKKLLKYYADFHDFYLNQSPIGKNTNHQQSYLQRIGMKLLQNPINFYLNKSHEIVINRMLRFCSDSPECLNNIGLPLILIFAKIKQQFRKQEIHKRYRNQFICYYQMILSQHALSSLTKDKIIQNTGFFKAKLQSFQSQLNRDHRHANTLFMINIHPFDRDITTENGYIFISENSQNIYEQQNDKQEEYFRGFTHVLFNLLNTFKIIQCRFDNRSKMHIIEIQYGYISAQLQKRRIVNFISEQQNIPRMIQKQQQQFVDYENIIKYQSYKAIFEKISDFGDIFCLLSRHNQAINYYDTLFSRSKAETDGGIFILSMLQSKKAKNLQLGMSPQSALQYYYNAFNFIRKARLYSDIEMDVICNLYNANDYSNLVTFGEELLRIAVKYQFLDKIQLQFLLKLYGFIAKAQLKLNTIDFTLKINGENPLIAFQRGLKVVQQIGEFNLVVADFYIQLGYYYLIASQPFQALIYLNKSLLIKKTILSECNPIICDIYEMLTIGYIFMHDYTQALKSINLAIQIKLKYFDVNNYRFLLLYELSGKIHALLRDYQSSENHFQKLEQIINSLEAQRNYHVQKQRKFSFKHNLIGLFNVFEGKQLRPFFDIHFRKDKSEICMVYQLLYRAYLCKIRYNYNESLLFLQRAYQRNSEQLGVNHLLNIQILMLMADNHIQSLKFKQADRKLTICLQIINKYKREQQYEGLIYYSYRSKLAQEEGNVKDTLKWLLKQREIICKLVGKQSLEVCDINSKIIHNLILQQKIPQARQYFEDINSQLPSILLKTKSQHSATSLTGNQLDSFMKNYKIHQAQALELKATLQVASSKSVQAIQTYKQALENYKQVIGEYHPKTAHVLLKIGQCLSNLGGETNQQAINQLKKALSITQNSESQSKALQIQIHKQMAVIYQAKNQLLFALQELSQTYRLYKIIKKLGLKSLQVLREFHRILNLFITNTNEAILKNVYFVISKMLAEQKSRVEEQLQIMTNCDAKSAAIFSEEVKSIIQQQTKIRQKINQFQTKDQRQEQQLLKRLQRSSSAITLQKIKENFQIRKKLRDKRPKHPT